jgi:hypothetical protein
MRESRVSWPLILLAPAAMSIINSTDSGVQFGAHGLTGDQTECILLLVNCLQDN